MERPRKKKAQRGSSWAQLRALILEFGPRATMGEILRARSRP